MLLGELPVGLSGILAGARGDLRGEEVEDDAVLVRGPHRPVEAQERGAGALLAAEADRAVDEPVDEPLEPDRHLDQSDVRGRSVTLSIMLLLTRVLPTAVLSRPSAPVAVQVRDRHRQVMVGVEQAAARVTTPCRSESVSLAQARSKSSLSRMRLAIAYGEEQSIRILPSRSTVMNRKVGSTVLLTTVIGRLCRSAISCQ